MTYHSGTAGALRVVLRRFCYSFLQIMVACFKSDSGMLCQIIPNMENHIEIVGMLV
jgi:hypothetical protein